MLATGMLWQYGKGAPSTVCTGDVGASVFHAGGAGDEFNTDLQNS